MSCSTGTTVSSSGRSSVEAPRSSHVHQWSQRYNELVKFRDEFHHCLVPLNWSRNKSLANWVKRQRNQYRLKMDGGHSTLTDERQVALESLGFTWDSHSSGWDTRWEELRTFRDMHGHCNVPKNYSPHRRLAVWVKCQRRQFKLYEEGKSSTITEERIKKLLSLGFVFAPRRRTAANR